VLRIAVLGCGRIGQMHATNVARHPRAELAAVFDVNRETAERVALAQGVSAAGSAEEIFSSDKVDAVLIATATPTHADYIEMAVAAGKAVLCEKPIDLNIARVNACAAKIAGTRVPIQLGFNRRYDPGHSAARAAMVAGASNAISTIHAPRSTATTSEWS
jgi:myo-inositol 2-dehydrogenase / D-chiro-inositol 1-dehydrogenase